MADPRYGLMRWKRLRTQAKTRDGNRCTVPGCTNRDRLDADHVVEASDGGAFWDLSNIVTLCKPHHDSKTRAMAAGRGSVRSPNA